MTEYRERGRQAPRRELLPYKPITPTLALLKYSVLTCIPRPHLRILLAAGLLAFVAFEMRTSWVQSRLLAEVAGRLTFSVEAGTSPSIRYPETGPYNDRLGYSKLSGFLERLRRYGFEVEAQARSSTLAVRLMDKGLYPIYREKTQAGLKILDRSGQELYATRYPERTYSEFDEIPPVVVQTLLFIENREMLNHDYPYRNPSVEWERLAGAVLDFGLHTIHRSHRLSGGSTLATQIEKIRHSPGGRTPSVQEKLRQMLSASLRVYQDGQQTMAAQKRIVLDYINSIPLSGAPGYGEVQGLGDGLWAWYGKEFEKVNRLLAEPLDELGTGPESVERARAYRQVLSLLLAVNSPTTYLLGNHRALEARTDSYLRLLSEVGVISPEMRDLALPERVQILDRAPAQPPVPFAERKGIDAIRVRLLPMLGIDSTYDLDRLDLTVSTALEGRAQAAVTRVLQMLQEPEYAAKVGLTGHQLLTRGDPSLVKYSFTLYERAPGANLLRLQADNYNQPLNLNEGTRLELGSTAKLRTLVNYLDIVCELHERFAAMPPDELSKVQPAPNDRLTRWAVDHLRNAQDKRLAAMLDAALQRRYSASPAERFFTGGGLHTFSNFDSKDNARVMTVSEAFQRSVNLVFIRMMRDMVQYYAAQVESDAEALLRDANHPRRMHYLSRFADREGRQFLARFHQKHGGLEPDESLRALVGGIRPTPVRLAVIYRSVRPEAGVESLAEFLREQLPSEPLTDTRIEALYEQYGPDRFDLADRGYLARVHPLELWLVEYVHRNPTAGLRQVLDASAEERQHVYGWLFRTRNKNAQDRRIRIMLEVDAFARMHAAWVRQGYPFSSLVPSYATSIGSSGDNPAALAELMGIIVNDGVRYPTLRMRRLHFAKGTPVETVVAHRLRAGERVYPTELASAVRRELVNVVEAGTGRRASGAAVLSDGTTVEIGGKTGTGDNRFGVYSRSGHRLDSRVINRTATFVFLIGNRFYGTITAYVPGEDAASYRFTSALPVQTFNHLVPTFLPLLEESVDELPSPVIRVEGKPAPDAPEEKRAAS